MKLKINETDLKRIEGKLNKLKDFGKQGTKVYQYRLDLLENYKTAVTSLMGTVNASGGVVSINFMDKSQMAYWEGLADSTIALKKAKAGWRLEIWEASGETKRAVRVRRREGFAGIDKATDPEAFRKALNTEFGGTTVLDGPVWSERGLFTIANNIFKENKDLIVKAISKLIREDIRWGS